MDNLKYQLERTQNQLDTDIQGIAFLNDNQIARLSSGSTSDVYAAADIHNYYAYVDTYTGMFRYAQAKLDGEDPSKYTSWITGDEQKRAKLVADGKLLLLPYNTQVRVVKYQKDKLDDWAVTQTGKATRLGRYQVQILDGPNKDLKVWTQDVVDLLPHAGDPAYLGIQPGTKTIGDLIVKPIPYVSFDEGQVNLYWEAVMKGDDQQANMFLQAGVFPVHINTKCQIIKEDKPFNSEATYYFVKIVDGPRTGKIVWTLNLGLTPFPTSTTNLADHTPFVGDTAYVGDGHAVQKQGATCIAATDNYFQLSLYLKAVASHDDQTATTILNIEKAVLPIPANSRCTVLAMESNAGDQITYYHVKLEDGDLAGKTYWIKDVSLDPVSTTAPVKSSGN